MKITATRRISQLFFLLLFVWLCVVSTSGTEWYQKRGWPVNWLLQLDPLVAVGVGLAAGALTIGLLWGLATVVLTLVFGRVFCGWVCPFGTIHQAVGYLGRRGKKTKDQILINRYRPWQAAKYYILLGMLAAAAVGAIGGWGQTWGVLLTGLLDPIPLLYRSVNLVALPIADGDAQRIWTTQRLTDGSLVLGALFVGAVLANLWIPRFFCRFVCPLGALLGILSRISLFRVGRKADACTSCGLCETDCEGACSPTAKIRSSECVMCLNCFPACRHGAMVYQTRRSPAGEVTGPDISRRGVLASIVTGLVAAPLLRLAGKTSLNWSSEVIRPPGALVETDFLKRCIKCGQCIRVCPTNVLQPAGTEGGFEAVWTPKLNNRIGTSGCQLNCVACGHSCPTGAIRPLSLDEKHGVGEFAEAGPIRIGTAFVDRNRCLPWAMDRPCIVCQENCPVSPKAIGVQEVYNSVPNGQWKMAAISDDGEWVRLAGSGQAPDLAAYTTGDYFANVVGNGMAWRRAILDVADWAIRVSDAESFRQAASAGRMLDLQVRLQRPMVDPARCIGCGVCEHECPVSGKRAIRVTAENESRDPDRSLLL